jgi:alpha-L-rhamnosidase
VAGINADEQKPGYKHIIIKPQPGGGLSHAKAAYDSMHGLIESAWSLSGNRLTLRVCIPANARATVIIPAQYCSSITEGGHPVALQDGKVHIGSGQYEFHCSG